MEWAQSQTRVRESVEHLHKSWARVSTRIYVMIVMTTGERFLSNAGDG